MPPFQSGSARWSAVASRDELSNGHFVYCVKTTGIYCRPICKARLARRANVEFHDTAAAAQKAGYRACKRCKPELDAYNPHSVLVAQAKRTIEAADMQTKPTLKELAAEAGLSEWHFHRVFRSVTGVTPKAYAKHIDSVASDAQIASTSPALSTSSTVVDMTVPLNHWKLTDYATFFASSDDDDIPAASAKDICYTIQPWASSFVLIALTQDGICALDTGESDYELLESLRSLFPLSPIHVSDWNGLCERKYANTQYGIFETIMEGLMYPSGKMLDLSFDIGS